MLKIATVTLILPILLAIILALALIILRVETQLLELSALGYRVLGILVERTR
jgi:hypothetical protein